MPAAPENGVYKTLSEEPILFVYTAVPLVGFVKELVVNSSPSGSLSFEPMVIVVASFLEAEVTSSKATGGELSGFSPVIVIRREPKSLLKPSLT